MPLILPIFVPLPTAVARITPSPSTTMAERKSISLSDAGSAAGFLPASFFTAGLPLSGDSSTTMACETTSCPSAGISSPCERMIISPTTTSQRGISQTLPRRTTFTGFLSLFASRREKHRAAWFSKAQEMAVVRNRAQNTPTVSAYRFSIMLITSERQAATRRILTTGSENLAI